VPPSCTLFPYTTLFRSHRTRTTRCGCSSISSPTRRRSSTPRRTTSIRSSRAPRSIRSSRRSVISRWIRRRLPTSRANAMPQAGSSIKSASIGSDAPAASRRPRWNPWLVVSGAVALGVAAPIFALVVTASSGSEGLWSHLTGSVLPAAIRDTLVLLVGVGVLTALIGTGTAWLVAAHDFPGRRLFDWALLLPLAVPTYIIAYAYLDVLHPVGPVQTLLRALLGIESPRDFRLPDVRSMAGCIFVLGFVLYPYVYLTTRAMFLMQSANLIDAARTLGAGRAAVFLRIALPLARPAVAI